MMPCYLFWIRRYLIPQFSRPIKPEVILPPTFFGAFALPICLFWYGWTSRPDIHWMVPLVGSGSFTISLITLFMPVLTYLGMAYMQYAASVLAGNTIFRASCVVVFLLFVSSSVPYYLNLKLTKSSNRHELYSAILGSALSTPCLGGYRYSS
jgi:DHA1 family multidrug resistance protein-like MFS transporter